MSLLSPQLNAFMAIVSAQTVHGAAEKLYLTQTAVTQRLRNLEKQLKTTLFIRSRRGMLLTQEGEALWRYCQNVKLLEGEALAAIQKTGSSTQVAIILCGPTSIMNSRIIPSLPALVKKFPHLNLHCKLIDSEIRHELLRQGTCDVAILREQNLSKELKSKKLSCEEYILVCSSQWRERSLTEIITHEHAIDFNSEDEMTLNYLKHYHLFDAASKHRHLANNTASLALMASEGLGYTVLTKEFAAPYIKSKKLIALNQNRAYKIHHYLAWYDRPVLPAYFSAVLDAIH